VDEEISDSGLKLATSIFEFVFLNFTSFGVLGGILFFDYSLIIC